MSTPPTTGGNTGPEPGPPPTSRAAEERGTEVGFRHSPSFPHVLEDAGCSLLISTYQAGQLVAVGASDGQPTFSFRRFDRAMGVAVGADTIAVAGKDQIWSLRNHSEVAAALAREGDYDGCWLPRTSIVTGPVQCHEIAWGRGRNDEPELWIVNTLHSCVAGLDRRYSFVPRWRPSFVSTLAAQDRCHLNGLAMRDGSPAFVTVFAPTDSPAGWRTVPNDSGQVLDVASGEAVSTGLAMPHSPRWHNGDLYVLNSGLGHLEQVDLGTGRRSTVALLPGYARGLAFHDGLAFVGLSKIRETAIFGGSPIAAFHDELKCGIGVVELSTGNTVATLQFTNAVTEIFDVQLLPTVRRPSLGDSPDTGQEIWVLPDPASTSLPAR